MVSQPSVPMWNKTFDYMTGNFALRFESWFTYNSVFGIRNFTLKDKNKDLSYLLSLEQTVGKFSFYNMAEFHDMRAVGIVEIAVSSEWFNESLSAEIEVISNMKISLIESETTHLEYRRLFEGTFFLKLV